MDHMSHRSTGKPFIKCSPSPFSRFVDVMATSFGPNVGSLKFVWVNSAMSRFARFASRNALSSSAMSDLVKTVVHAEGLTNSSGPRHTHLPWIRGSDSVALRPVETAFMVGTSPGFALRERRRDVARAPKGDDANALVEADMSSRERRRSARRRVNSYTTSFSEYLHL